METFVEDAKMFPKKCRKIFCVSDANCARINVACAGKQLLPHATMFSRNNVSSFAMAGRQITLTTGIYVFDNLFCINLRTISVNMHITV